MFTVHLKCLIRGSETSGGSSGWGEGTMYAIGNEIRSLLGQVTTHKDSPFMSADYSWEPSAGAMKSNETLIHFVNSGGSLITEFDGRSVPTAGGTVLIRGTGVISEVYVDRVDGDPHFVQKLARVAVHELMHNKLDAVDPPNRAVSDIHAPLGGLGMALHQVEWDTQFTLRNLELLAKNLSRAVPQFTSALSRKGYPQI